MGETTIFLIGFTFFLYVLLVFYGYIIGGQASEFILRLLYRNRRHLLSPWGLETEVFNPRSWLWFSALFVAAIMFTAFLSLIVLIAIAALLEGDDATLASVRHEQVYEPWLLGLAMSTMVGVMQRMVRADSLIKKVKRLNALSDKHKSHFKHIELLAIYESLQPAPNLFWDKFAKLTPSELDESTLGLFITLGTPYRFKQAMNYHRATIGAAFAAIVVTILLAWGGGLWRFFVGTI